MITVFDMATGEILARSAPSAAPEGSRSNGYPAMRLLQPRLQEIQIPRPEVRMPPDQALFDIAEVLALYH